MFMLYEQKNKTIEAKKITSYSQEKKNMSGCPFMNNPSGGGSAIGAPPSQSPFIQPKKAGDAEEMPSILGFVTPSAKFLPNQAGAQKQQEYRAETGQSPTRPGEPAKKGVSPERESITGACHYSDYLRITDLLNMQSGPSESKPGGQGMMHHEENLFVIVHQTFELWFKMVIVDLEKCRNMMSDLVDAATAQKKDDAVPSSSSSSAAAGAPAAAAAAVSASANNYNNNINNALLTTVNGQLSLCLNYLRRIEQIITHATGAFGIIETMHCGDFLEFRDYLLPASGFQSVQFRKLERQMGLQDEPRAQVNGVEVFKYLLPDEQESLDQYVNTNNVNHLVNKLLATLNVPDNFIEVYQESAHKVMIDQQTIIAKGDSNDPKIKRLIEGYVGNLRAILDDPVGWCEGLTLKTDAERAHFKKAVLACLYVYTYRHEPELAVLASVLEQLVAVEESLLVWRSRHLHMAERMIGRRTGTGGSSGVGYLDVTRRYRIFHALWLVRKLTIRGSALPALSTLREPGAKMFI